LPCYLLGLYFGKIGGRCEAFFVVFWVFYRGGIGSFLQNFAKNVVFSFKKLQKSAKFQNFEDFLNQNFATVYIDLQLIV